MTANVIDATARFSQPEPSIDSVDVLAPAFRVFWHLRDEVAREQCRRYEHGDEIKRAWLEVCARGEQEQERLRMLRIVSRA